MLSHPDTLQNTKARHLQLGYAYTNPISLDNKAAKTIQKASKDAPKYIPYSEVQKHTTRESCWVIIDGQVYDATSVLRWHPAGPEVILNLAGQDATYVVCFPFIS